MQPILFEWGFVRIPAYGTFVLLALASGLLLAPRYARRSGLDPWVLRKAFFIVFLSGALGCRLLWVFMRLPEVIEEPRLAFWMLQQAGVWYGAILGGLIGGGIVMRLYRIDFWRLFDAAAVPAVLGGGIGRIGCFLSGCCWGTPTDRAWGVRYTNELAHRLHPELPYERLHPVVLYELGGAIAIALALDRLGSGTARPGQLGLLWLSLYAPLRFLLEYFRGDGLRGSVGGAISTSQMLSVAVGIAAFSIWLYRRRGAA